MNKLLKPIEGKKGAYTILVDKKNFIPDKLEDTIKKILRSNMEKFEIHRDVGFNWDKVFMVYPCPFCGSKNVDIGDNYCCGNYYILCNDCHGMIHDGETIEEVVDKWNNRL